jgi:outer membrane receptor protein involved in Fe transport
MRSILLYLLVAPFMVATTFGQGSIRGTVTDTETGEGLPGVNVIVIGTAFGAATDFDGNYSIPGLRAGSYNVQASFIGYETRLYTGIRVNDGQATQLNIQLAPAVLEAGGEIVVIGERPLVDVEQSASVVTITRDQIEAAPVREVQAVIATQAGVVLDPTGLYIRGGRAEETGFYVDGVSARDPLAGTGFGIDLGSNAFAEVEVVTGGIDASIGDVTSGVVSVRTRDGTDTFQSSVTHKRDNVGFNDTWGSTFNEEVYELTFSGPIIPRRLRFFTSAQAQLTDEFTRHVYPTAFDVRTSLTDNGFWTPRVDNRWNGLGKLTWLPRSGMRLEASYQRSLTVNQNTRMLQVTGNDDVIRPGFQYAFLLQPENANTYAHDNTIAYLRWRHALDAASYYEIQLSRLFTRLRADANGREWRPLNVDTELDPTSIVEYPGTLFLDENGNPIDPNAMFVLPGPGLFNNNGLATRWHDHFAEEVTLRSTYTRFFANRDVRLDAGLEMKFNDYQWIDIIRPWVGAPVIVGADTLQTNRLGEASDIWRVQPGRGGAWVTTQLRYRGLIANLGGRFEYWMPGGYVDDLVTQEVYTIPEPIRQGYLNDTHELFGRRFKFNVLPRLRVSFPVQENRVLFFNYAHTTRLPHPTFVYAGLDPFYQSRSYFADLGNPNLDPEIDINYELGLRTQITQNDALTLTGFWRDKYDFISGTPVTVRDALGRETSRFLRINNDFARVRGVEASYLKRVGQWFQGQVVASYSRATGLSSTNSEALQQLLQQGNFDNTVETPLAWDRPLDLKANVLFRYDQPEPLLGVPGFNRFSVYVASTFRSGQRYTPVHFAGRETNPFTNERDWRPIYVQSDDPADRFSAVGAPWWWFDLNARRMVDVFGNDLVFSLEVTNLFNQMNASMVNPVTGRAYPNVSPEYVRQNAEALRDDRSFDVPNHMRDPRYEDPRTTGLPPFNPARFLPQRHIVFGIQYRF